MVKYKKRCIRCREKYIAVSARQNFPMCYDCQKNELHKPITVKKWKKFFEIPEEFYKENLFLRDIKLNYLKFGKLSEKQVAAFKKVVNDLKEKAKEKKK